LDIDGGLGTPVVSQAADSYLCITEQSSGFAYDKARQQWRTAQFTAGKKYVIRRGTKDTTAAWSVWKFGDDNIPDERCEQDFNEYGMLLLLHVTLRATIVRQPGVAYLGGDRRARAVSVAPPRPPRRPSCRCASTAPSGLSDDASWRSEVPSCVLKLKDVSA
jgi:hypothetical protein